MPRDRTTRKLYNRPDDRRQNYPSDDGRAIVGPMLPKRGNMGRPRRTGLRSVFDGVRHILSNGRRWRALPTDIHRIPPTGTVSTPGARAVRRACPDSLRDLARQCAGRSPEPTAAAIDSQSVRTTGSGGPRGHDAGRKVKGRKRTVAADLEGTPVVMTVHTADIQDRDGAPDIIAKSPVTAPDVRGPLADGGHPDPKPRERLDGTGPADIIGTVGKPEDVKGFMVPRRRRVLERTFAWMGRCRRLSKDCERLSDSSLVYGVRHSAPLVRAGVRHERTLAACRFPIRRVARELNPRNLTVD